MHKYKEQSTKYKAAMFLFACVACVACVASVAGVRAEIIDRVLAVVGGVVITQSDAMAAIDVGLVTVGQAGDPIGAALAQLIDRELMLLEVVRYAPQEPAADAVDRRLQAARARFASPAAWEAMMARSGLDEPRLRKLLRDQVGIDAYLDQRFGAPPLTPERRTALIAEWVNGLRRRTEITNTYLPRR